jgi:hypothetical protein
MERLHQGHLHPKLEVPGLTCLDRNRNWASMVEGEHSKKEPFETDNLIAIRNLDNNL